jgi:CRISPR-associated protein Csb2
MTSNLCLTIRFLQPYYHGRSDGDEPEWPPSPLRLFQALIAAAAARWRDTQFRTLAAPAFDWLEQQAAPSIVAPAGRAASTKYRMYVPDNTGDLAAGTWSRGDADKIIKRSVKDVLPTNLGDDAVHYVFPVGSGCEHFDTFRAAARSVTHLGWGVDMVAGNASMLSEQELSRLEGERWLPSENASAAGYRVPVEGTLDALLAKHCAFLQRISRDEKGNESFNPVPPLSAFRVMGYRRASEAVGRPYAVFEMRTDEDARYSHRQEQLIHIAGMVRHLAIEQMKKHPPSGVPADWVERYVAGHRDADAPEHKQFSYLPLPSIGHQHADPGVRRVMVAAPIGDERWLEHLAKRLAGMKLRPTPQSRIDSPPTLRRVWRDNVASFYTNDATEWASVTPVILPGHDDHKPAKTRKLIEKALLQSDISQECEFEWSPYSKFSKSLSAHKYDREKRPAGYFRPDHLLNLSAVHLQIRFKNEVKGPIAIGAGRHCGLGLMAAVQEH